MSDSTVEAAAAQPPTVAADTAGVDETPAVEAEVGDATADNGNAGQSTTQDTSKLLKTTGRINRQNHQANVKTDASLLPETDDPRLIRNQVEFYFGDSNLPVDKYMWGLTGGEDNKPVPVKKLCEFKRMRRFNPYESVVKALRDSDLLEVVGEEGDECVKRKLAYVPNRGREGEVAASVYAKGFGDEQPSTQFDIEAFFAPHGPINAIRLRRTPEKFFKGSVFVEFQTEELARKFLSLDPPPKWEGHDLKIMSKRAYMDEKTEQIREGKIQPGNTRPKFYEGHIGQGQGRGRGGFHRRERDGADGIDKDDWKKRRDHDQRNGFRGRGRGRGGGRGRGRGDRNHNHSRRSEPEPEPERQSDNDVKPVIHSSKDSEAKAGGKTDGQAANDGKRMRDEQDDSERPAKKVDVGQEASP